MITQSMLLASDELTITNNIDCGIIGKDFYGQTDAADSLTITAGAGLTMNADLLLGNGSGNSGIALDNAGAITVAGGAGLSIAGNIVNSGTIELHTGSNSNGALLLVGGDVTLSGGGGINLNFQSGEWNRNEITGYSTTTPAVLHNVDNTISGGGWIGQRSVEFGPRYGLIIDNQAAGVINADSSVAA